MGSVYVLIHEIEAESGESIENIISAHPTRESAVSAERFFRDYGSFKRHNYEQTQKMT